MGKKGEIKLIMPKNSGDKELLDTAINIVNDNGGVISTRDFSDKMSALTNIKNIGSDEMLVMLWANEVFDQENPDTIWCEV